MTTIGPDFGTVIEPEQGLIFASEGLLAHELLFYVWLQWNREFETSGLAKLFKGNLQYFRSFINKKMSEKIWAPVDEEEIAEIPVFTAGVIHNHPTILNHMIRQGGKPAGINWKSVNKITDPAIAASLKQQIEGS